MKATTWVTEHGILLALLVQQYGFHCAATWWTPSVALTFDLIVSPNVSLLV